MELQVNGASPSFAIPAEVNNINEPGETCDVCQVEEETAFPLALFETSKALFDLGMATWFRLLATGTNADE